jgi:ATP-dependent RNA helicase SUPV3L1/SUV3
MEKRPKPVKVAEAETPPALDAAARTSDQPAAGFEQVADTVIDSPIHAAGETTAGVELADQEAVPHDPTVPGMTLHASNNSAAMAARAEAQSASDPAAPVPDEVAVVAEAGAPDAPVAAMGEATVDPELPQVPGVTAEPEFIDVWRPGGRSEERRGQQRRSPQRQRARPTHAGAPAVSATGERAAEGRSESVVEEGTPIGGAPHRRQRGPQREFRREREDGGERRQRDHRSERQGDRTERGRGEPPHFVKARTEHKDRRDYEREKPADPNSPFAKLAALKAQLEANAKERR